MSNLKADLNEFKSDATSVLIINLFDNTLLLKAHSSNLGDWEHVNGYYNGYLIALLAAYGPSTNGIPTIIPYKENAQYNWKKGFYGYAPTGSKINDVLYGMTIDFDNIIIDETGSDVNFTIYNTGATASSGMPGYGVGRGIPTALVEMAIAEFKTAIGSSEVMQSGSSQTMKYAQEWYWNVIANMACAL